MAASEEDQGKRPPQLIKPSPMRQRNVEKRLTEQSATSGLPGKQGGSQLPALVEDIDTIPQPLAELKGMKPLEEELRAAYGQTWSKIVYHPYYEEFMLMVAVPLERPDGKLIGTILLHHPLSGIEELLRRIYLYVAMGGVASFILTALVANYLAGGMVRQLQAMQRTAKSLAQGDYSAQALVETEDEVGDLGRSLNELAGELQEYVGQLEVQDRMRRDFVANVSHELKTPLTILRGYNEALADGTIADPGEAEKYRRIMSDEIGRMEKLIAELLDLSLLQSDATAMEKEPVSLAEVAESVQVLMEQRSRAQNVDLQVLNTAGTAQVLGDGNRLTQLLLILVDNALKFTPGGGTVTVRLAESPRAVVLSVEDTGQGIPAGDLPYIWERFYKGDKSRRRANGGTGLGLSIAREIVHLHDATAKVESEQGKGTRFTICFPG